MLRSEVEPYISKIKDFSTPRPQPVTQEEIDSANRFLSRSGGIMGLAESDLLRRAEEAGQHLEVDSFFPDNSPFLRTQITRDAFGEVIRRKNAKPYNKPVPETFLK